MEARDPRRLTSALRHLVDVLLPGDELFPKASDVGLQAVLADRLRASQGEAGLDRLLEALDASGGPLEAREHPEFFRLVRTIAFLGYYESPAVHAAIRALGRPYHAAPLPEGYDPPPFDPEVDTPRHGRGFHKRTEEVTRVDLGGLDFLKPAEIRHG